MEEASELGKGWFECFSCGATWIDTTHLGDGKLPFKGVPWDMWFGGGRREAKEMGFL